MAYHRIIIGACLAMFLIAEVGRPLRGRTRPWLRRVMVNLVISGLAFAAGTFVVRYAALGVSSWTIGQGVGILTMIPIPPVAQWVVGFLLMDLTFYYWHRVNHLVPVLWRFHNVHHIDPDLDVTTSFRFHVVEILFSTVFRVVQVVLIGVAPIIYFWYEFVFTIATLFHHSNVRLPIALERVLNAVIVTPRMHGIHHSDVKEEGNSNYSVIFRWWDWMHGSLRVDVPQSAVRIGVPAYVRPEDNGLLKVLFMPFARQREYGRYAEGTESTRDPSELVAGARSLAE